ncbi:MAG: 2-amino-4-hydroxy-6-hydroxymethyldihydropteridine diphosphokinase, partial [Terriglobales bacterium]
AIFDAAVAAIGAMQRAGLRVRRVSPYRRTAPEDATGRHWYLNAAVELETEMLPRVLLRRLRRIELQAGRHTRGHRHPPRTLDLDLLIYDRARISTPELEVPHPRLARSFVLAALADLNPKLRPPGAARSVQQMLALFPSRFPRQ